MLTNLIPAVEQLVDDPDFALYEYVDPEALERLLARDGARSFTFAVEGTDVTVYPDGSVDVG